MKDTGPPGHDTLGITRDTADEDILRAVVVGPSQPARSRIVSGMQPAKRRATRVGGKKRASNPTATTSRPEARLASRWLSSAEVKQLERDTGTCRILWTAFLSSLFLKVSLRREEGLLQARRLLLEMPWIRSERSVSPIFLYFVLNAWVPGEWPLARKSCRYYLQWRESQI